MNEFGIGYLNRGVGFVRKLAGDANKGSGAGASDLLNKCVLDPALNT